MGMDVIERIPRDFLGLSAVGFHRVAYGEWRGDAVSGPPVVCVHGLTRNGRDFDPLARALAAHHARRVVCPDVVGRGESDWLPNPDLYGYPLYLADMAVLVARLDADSVDWVGTSMGGLIGMLLAAQPKTPIRRLIMNDVGPLVTKSGLERIAGYVGKDPVFEDMPAVEAYYRLVLAGFGNLSDLDWRHLATHGVRTLPDGRFGMAYDPGIAEVFKKQPVADVDLWAVWDMIDCPVLVIRGETSDILTRETAEEMTRRGPKATVVEIEATGHAPGLMDDHQIGLIERFLAD